jgi:hypothetical protein
MVLRRLRNFWIPARCAPSSLTSSETQAVGPLRGRCLPPAPSCP